ncbi:helix-turn-helix domain-containing protein [Thiothrix fructosivorans]|uniref:Helix-turn-helix domain containing protein n=1 Tax=Thiothrix fructosivorans TaxID=111770 RepID=A0A8B0SPX2_9GAMM|nr:helix-turn-helix domain-containing protein [Thiothrix fructosivorans]MBO0611441.1 helix-turn-helix domain containing protein [Thiothrix fructosivorans]QTX12999.1 helix-turn-helix domain containing protein [Thiothrix fructosivorans]
MDGLATLSEQDRQIALERFHLLQPYLENQVRLRQIAQDISIPYRTLQHWIANYHQLGLAGLTRKTRSDQGKRRGLSVGLQQFIEGLALQKPPLPITAIHRQVSQLANDRQEKIPHYHQVYSIMGIFAQTDKSDYSTIFPRLNSTTLAH